jgi:competence protein ComEA
MSKLTTLMLAAATSLGLAFASTAAIAQKAETPKDAKPAATKPAAAKPEAAKPAAKADTAKAEAAKPAAEPMDINSASEAELASLKGIGPVRAKAIVKGRPYKGKDDLVSKKIVPKNVYEDIKEQIIAKQDTAKKPPAKKG